MVYPSPRSVFLALSLIAIAGCGQQDESGEPAGKTASAGPAASLAVTLVAATRRPIERTLIASGPVTAWEEMQLGVELGGLRVTALNVDVGQRVRKGQVLLEIDHRTLDSDLRQAQAALGEAEAGLALARINLGRGQGLAKSQLISASALDELRASVVQAEARLSTTRAQRDGVQLRRDFASLRAPDDGVISKRLVQPGQVVVAGTELLRMIRQGRLEWRPELPEAQLSGVAVGAAAILRDGSGKPISGRVRAVSPGVDTATRTGTIYVDLPEPGALKAGAFVEGRLITSAATALMVPVASVVMRDGYAYVFTADEKGLVRRLRVRTGASVGDQVEIIEGLRPGQT
ncbi:MAG: efflux RND transporter periplasmic adaptor subunit, partial [Arenimonas sp.]|nr:efflux RND transporter periplasmic adaptor subunit [Arenimonas sp.]